MLNLAVAFVGILIGALLIAFRKYYASYCVERQNRLWGFRFGEKTVRLTTFVLVFIGLGFITIGMLSLVAMQWATRN